MAEDSYRAAAHATSGGVTVLTEHPRAGGALELESTVATRVTIACRVGGRMRVEAQRPVPVGRGSIALPQGPASYPGELVAVAWTLTPEGAGSIPLDVLPGTATAPRWIDRLAAVEPAVRGAFDAITQGAFALLIFGVVARFAVLDPSAPLAARLTIGAVLVLLGAAFAWAPLAALARWTQSARVRVPPRPGVLRPGDTWVPGTRTPWRLDIVEREYVRGRRRSGGAAWSVWKQRALRVTVQRGEPGEAVRIPERGPVNARAARAAVCWEWVTWDPTRPSAERRLRLDVR